MLTSTRHVRWWGITSNWTVLPVSVCKPLNWLHRICWLNAVVALVFPVHFNPLTANSKKSSGQPGAVEGWNLEISTPGPGGTKHLSAACCIMRGRSARGGTASSYHGISLHSALTLFSSHWKLVSRHLPPPSSPTDMFYRIAHLLRHFPREWSNTVSQYGQTVGPTAQVAINTSYKAIIYYYNI